MAERIAGKFQAGTARCQSRDLDLTPGNSPSHSGTQGLGRCLFGRKTGGETLGMIALCAAIGDFPGGVDAAQKTLAIARNRAGNALHFDQVHAGTDEHADHSTMGNRKSYGAC